VEGVSHAERIRRFSNESDYSPVNVLVHQYRTAQVRPTIEVEDVHGVATLLETFDVATVRIQAWWRMASAILLYRSVRVCWWQFARGLQHGSITNA
jgi:hypothetical protein